MHQLDEQLRALRPHIATEPAHNQAEAFQNETLRPILKLLNDRLLVVFLHYLRQRKATFSRMSVEDRQKYIEHALRTDQKLRHLFKGMMMGQLTTDEWVSFMKAEDELSRRLISLIIQRLTSQLDFFRD